MKKDVKLFCAIAFIAIIGFSMVACGDDSDSNPFIGTWTGLDLDGDYMILRFESNNYNVQWPNSNFLPIYGTYTYSGNTATLMSISGAANGTATVSGNTLTGVLGNFAFSLTK